jgi:hypothetical protein
MERTNVLASQTSKKNQIAMLALAAALYGLISAPGTGCPLTVGTSEIWVVLARALTAHHMASNEIAAARQIKSYERISISPRIVTTLR